MSYRKNHIKSRVRGIKPKKSILTKLWFWLAVLFVAIIFSAIYLIVFYSGFQIKNIIISGNNKIKTQDLQEVIFNDAHTGLINFWGIRISSDSIFLVDENKINTDILKRFSSIRRATTNKSLPQTLTLYMVERKPVGVFCTSNNQCFSIDSNGIVFDPPTVLPINTTVVRQAFGDSQIFTGEQVVSDYIIKAIYDIQKSLKDNFQIDLTQALIISPVRLNVKTNQNWQIYFDLSPNYDISTQLKELGLLLNGGISAASKNNLRYIDLRPKDRAIICDNITCGG
jgi:cell division septal protein FtsQ